MFNTQLFTALANLERVESSLFEFAKAAWPIIEGDKAFYAGWHVQALCEHLEATLRGDIKKLLINVPPRTSKTNLISIIFPAWIWGPKGMPHIKFLYASYSYDISFEHSRICKMLIESHWYQERWGHIVQLSKDQSGKKHFANTAFGHRIATSVGGTGTALGGDINVGDDLNSTNESEVTRLAANDWLSRVWSSRLNPGGLGVNIYVQQRTHELDTTGYMESINKNYVKFVLPMEFEESTRCTTIVLPSTKGKVWQDPRTKNGELLCPEYIDHQKIAERKIELGSYNYAAQYQQRPSPEDGGIILRSWFQIWSERQLPTITYVIQCWDTALTEKKDSCYQACTTWGLFKDKNNITQVILLTAWRDKIGYHEVLKRAKRLHDNYLDIHEDQLEADYRREPDRVLIEAKATGFLLVNDLVSKGIPAVGFTPDQYGDKMRRVHLTTPYIESRRVWVASEIDSKNLLPDHEMLVHACTLFPKSESRDLVDTMTMALLYLTKEAKLLSHVMSPRFEREVLEGDILHKKEINRGVKIIV